MSNVNAIVNENENENVNVIVNENVNVNVCLICLEECKTDIIFECCGSYKIHETCYKKWHEINKNCVICKSHVNYADKFILYYVALYKIKLIVTIYCAMSLVCILYIIAVCDFNKDYCDLM